MKRLPFVLLVGFFPGCSPPSPLPRADAVSHIRVFVKFLPAEWIEREAFITDREHVREFIEVVGSVRSTGRKAVDVIGIITINVKSGESVELGVTRELGIASGGSCWTCRRTGCATLFWMQE